MNKSIYNLFAKKINSQLALGAVTVTDTSNIDKQYCDKYSLRLDDDVMSMLYENKDTHTAQVFFDTVLEYKGNKYYIEPYNSRLHNIAMI